jgi:hypothetical protein
MRGFRPSVIASVVLGLMTSMERFVGAMIAAGVPKCLLVVLVSLKDVGCGGRDGGYGDFKVTFREVESSRF